MAESRQHHLEDHKSGRRRDFHDDDDRSPKRRRDAHGDDRSPKRRRDDDDRSPKRRRDAHGDDRSPTRRRDFHGEDASPTRRRDFDGDDRSPRRRRDDGRFSNRRRDENHFSDDHRFPNDRDGISSFKDEDQRGGYDRRMGTGDETGIGRFADRQRRVERPSGRGGEEPDKLPELYSVHRAKVQSVRPFGLFVRLDGFFKQGLVHLSQLSNHEVASRDDPDELKLQAISAVAGEGDQVWVKVISLRQEEGGNVKIGCSLKFVSQSSGEDLDPNNVKLEQQQSRPSRPDPRKVTLDAIYDVVCSRCGGHGHLRKECYSTGEKAYELLSEDDDGLIGQSLQSAQEHNNARETATIPGLGRGRAMVQPAWMKHGIGVGTQGAGPTSDARKKKVSELPDTVTTVEEALALIAQVKKDKKDRKHKKHKRRREEKEHRKASKEERRKRKEKDGDRSKHGKPREEQA